MLSRFAGLLGLAALALSSSACTYKTQTQVREMPVDYSDAAYYDRSFAPSPSYQANTAPQTAAPETAAPAVEDEGMADAQGESRGRSQTAASAAIGFSAGHSKSVRAEATDTEYQEVEATPGTACYDAAVKAGIKSGTCTLISERKYVLVGQKAAQ